jgi:Arc-like DNA binding domain
VLGSHEVAGEKYRFLLRMPESLRRRLVEAAGQSGRSINQEIVTRLEESLERSGGRRRARRYHRVLRPVPNASRDRVIIPSREGMTMTRRRLRRRFATAGVLAGVAAAIVAGGLLTSGGGAPSTGPALETDELPPAFVARLGNLATPAPGSKQEGDRSLVDDEWVKHATPGLDRIPNTAIAGASSDWSRLSGRAGLSRGNWKPLGPTWAKGLPNQYRDRDVYNAGTPDFTGRIAHTVIDPGCRGGGGDDNSGNRCRLWIANANGGVWRTNNALADSPRWTYLSEGFEHNNVASLELDPNDRNSSTIYAGTGEPNACGSGCEAGVGIYKSTNGGNRWTGPFGQASGPACAGPATCNAFYNRAVGSIEVKPGNSNVIFAASGRAIRGLSSACCGGVDALIPGAAHFGLFRSLNGGQSWELVNQGAPALCTANTPDEVSLNLTPCSARGARRVMIDPVDPNTVYASFFARGIWRSNANGDPGTWTQIMAPVGPVGTTERAEFDLVRLPNGDTRMFVGVGGGAVPDGPDPGTAPDPVPAQVLRSNSVRTGMPVFTSLTSNVPDTPGFTSFGYCDPQCVYDNYIFAPAGHFPDSGASPDVVYLLGDNEYNENNWGPESPRFYGSLLGRSSGRGIALSENAGAAPGTVFFTDMTEDTTDDFYPVALHPDHHAIVVNPTNYKQFITVGDGGVARSNGTFVDDSEDCGEGVKGYTGSQLTFCELMLSSVPERIETFNEGLRTLHFYQINVSPHDSDTIVGGTQDNGSWERGDAPGSGTNDGPVILTPPDTSQFPTPEECLSRGRGDDDGNDDNGNSGGGGRQVWVNTNIADGGHNNFDIGDPCFRQTSFQVGQMMVHYEPKNQLDANWIADTLFLFYGGEFNAFVGVAIDDPVRSGWLWTSREHVFRSTNQGRNPTLTKQTHRENCNIWYGDFDLDDDGEFDPAVDICDDWKPLGDPGPNGRLTSPAYGADRIALGNYTAAIERGHDQSTLWAATSTGRIFVSKNANAADPATVVFDRIDDEDTDDPPRYPTAIYVDPNDSNHAWITYSGFNAKTPTTPGHVFEVRYVPGASTFTRLDGNEASGGLGDIPATSIAVTASGTIYVGTDFGVVASKGNGIWSDAAKGLPRMPASDLEYVPSERKLYAGTHGQGVWELKVHDIEGG